MPRKEVCHFYIRDDQTPWPATDADPEGLRSAWVRESAHPAFAALERFSASLGYGETWAADMVAQGNEAVLLLDGEGDSLKCRAFGWVTSSQLFVSEIGRTFYCDEGSDWLFADYVDPDYRGRGLQGWLLRQRLAQSAARGQKRVYALVRSTNTPSYRNVIALGFRPIGEVKSWFIRSWQIDCIRELSKTYRVKDRLSREGFPLPFSMRLRRKS